MIEIDEINVALGSITERNSKIEKEHHLKKGSIFNLTGIKRRTISNANETAESLAIQATKLFNKADLKKLLM